jgi:hypothetical protein
LKNRSRQASAASDFSPRSDEWRVIELFPASAQRSASRFQSSNFSSADATQRMRAGGDLSIFNSQFSI